MPSDYAVALSGKLLDYPPADVLVAGNLLQHYDPDLIRKMLDQLRPENLSLTRVAAGTQDRPGGGPLPGRLFGAEGSAQAREQGELATGGAAGIARAQPVHARARGAQAHRRPHGDPAAAATGEGNEPVATSRTTSSVVPRSVFVANFEFPMANDTPEHAVELQLFIDLVNDQLNEYAYTVSMAGLGYALGRTSKGMLLLLYGYDDKQSGTAVEDT